jgi:GNAT superfamily N-acetyltransferase
MDQTTTARRHDGYLISADPALLDRAAIHAALTESYWAAGVPRDVVDRSLDHSIAIGAYQEPDGPGGRTVQVGLVRAITDRATFAWLCDVYVLPEHQARGVAQAMLTALLEHPELQGLRRWLLATRDAHSLYERHGFRLLDETEQARYMIVRHTPYGPPTG